MRPKIGLVGYFGWGNFGDELFVKAHEEFLSDDYELEVVHDMLEAPYFTPERLENLSTFDGFLIGGGDLINPQIVSKLYWLDEYLQKPVFVYGIGVPTPNRETSKAINRYKEFFANDSLKCVVLRDKRSLDWFEKVIDTPAVVSTYPDAVCAMSLPRAVPLEEKTIGISIRSHRSVVGNYEMVREAADAAKELGYKVRLIVMSNGVLGEADYEVTQQFARGDEEIVYAEGLNEICTAIGECHQLVSMKFHGMIVATMYGVPSLQLAATQKNRNFLQYIQRPDMQSDYQSEKIALQIPRQPVCIHSFLRWKLRRDAKAGYEHLRSVMHEVYS